MNQSVQVPERTFEDYLSGNRGGFNQAIAQACIRADGGNLETLGEGFPEIVKAYKKYAFGDKK